MAPALELGLRANRHQFALLVLINAFVGAMVGLERTVVPLLAGEQFGVASRSAVLSFLVSFGLVKAVTNVVAGQLADRVGRRPVLVAGWLVGLPVPLLLIWAPSWGWVIAANALLGVNQGLCWSATVIMKIDLVGPARRGLAMGLNEAAGYVAVSLAALVTGYLASAHGLRPAPFYPGFAFAAMGLALSVGWVRDTRAHAALEGAGLARPHLVPVGIAEVLRQTSWRDLRLLTANQAGLVNNLNDGVVWGLVPIVLAARGLSLEQLATVAALYPFLWGLGQLGTGALSDRWGRKWLIASGMAIQAVGITLFAVGSGYEAWLAASALLGIGTALVYPTLLAAVSDVAPPSWRASAVGVYRLWRDSGYVVGALIAGALADAFTPAAAICAVAALTLASGIVVAAAMRETRPAVV